MTHLDLFRATVAHEPHEGFLYHASFTPDLDRRLREDLGLGEEDNIAEHFGMFAPSSVSPRAPEGLEAPDFSRYFEGEDIPEGAGINGIGVLNIPGSMYHFTRYVSPLRNASRLEDIEDFPFPSVKGFSEDHMVSDVETAHANGKVVQVPIGHIYESAWQIRGYEPFLMDMIERPEWCEHILDRIMEKNREMACAGARAGADYLMTGDDVANQRTLMFSRDQWRSFMKTRWEKVYSAAREIKPDIEIWYHSDGNIMDIIPELIEIGVTILNPVQPECMDPVEIKKKYGDRIVLDGTIGTQSTMPWGTPDDVRRVVKERIETLGGDGALMLGPTHVLEPEVPIENIKAFVEAAGTSLVTH